MTSHWLFQDQGFVSGRISEPRHDLHVQAGGSARACPGALSLVWRLVHLDVVEAGVEAGAQQVAGVAGRQRNQRASAVQSQRRQTDWTTKEESQHKNTKTWSSQCLYLWLFRVRRVGSTCAVLIPDLDGAVVGGRGHPGRSSRRWRQEHAAGCGLQVASVLHHFTAGLTQVPQLTTQAQRQRVSHRKYWVLSH